MRIASRVAGYSLAEADLLRKAIGKKKREIMLAEGEKFSGAAVEHGTPKKKAQELWSLIEPFARYGFNKSHAVAYALVAYKTAYLKAHYPGRLPRGRRSRPRSARPTESSRCIGDCQEMGIPVLPPDINESRKNFAAVGGSIRFGLAAIKGVGEAAAESILEERGKRPFASFTDFALRLDSHLVNKRTLDALIAAGAFDSLGKNRATLAAASERVVRARRPSAARRRSADSPTSSAAAARSPRAARADGFPDQPEWPLEERLKGEKEVLGFYVTGHPLTRFADEIERFADRGSRTSRAASTRPSGSRGVLVSLKKQKIKKGMNEGKTMLKATLEDTTRQRPGLHLRQPLREESRPGCARTCLCSSTAIVRESGGALELTIQDDHAPRGHPRAAGPRDRDPGQPRVRRRNDAGAPAGAPPAPPGHDSRLDPSRPARRVRGDAQGRRLDARSRRRRG